MLTMIDLVCPQCGDPFQRVRADALKPGRAPLEEQCCSITCSNKRRVKANIPAEVYVRLLLGESYRNTNGKERGFDLSEDQLQELWKQQDGRCAYTGVPFDLRRSTVRPMAAPSLDRIDNEKGYVPGNVQFVCTAVNRMKHTRTHEEVQAFVGLLKGGQ